jgi:hypothetical protein
MPRCNVSTSLVMPINKVIRPSPFTRFETQLSSSKLSFPLLVANIRTRAHSKFLSCHTILLTRLLDFVRSRFSLLLRQCRRLVVRLANCGGQLGFDVVS